MVNLKKATIFFLIIDMILVTCYSSDSFVLGLMGKNNVYYEKRSLLEIILVILILFCFLYMVKSNRFRINKVTTVVLIGIILIFTYGIILSYYNGYNGNLFTAFHNYRYFFYSIIICFMISSLPLKKNELNLLIDIFLITVLVKCIYGLFNFVVNGGNNFLILGNIVFAYGDTLNIILFATALSLSLYLYKKKTMYLIYTMMYFVVILLSMRRSVLGGLICILAISLIFSNIVDKLKLISAITVITIFAAVILNSPMVNGTKISQETIINRVKSINFLDTTNSDDVMTSDNGHVDDNLDAWDNVKDSPLWGKGLFATVRRPRVTWQADNTYFHNAYLGIWIQCGFLGFSCYILLLLLLIGFAINNILHNRCKYLNISYLSIVLIIIIQGFVTAPIYSSPGISIIFFILSGIVINFNKYEEIAYVQ